MTFTKATAGAVTDVVSADFTGTAGTDVTAAAPTTQGVTEVGDGTAVLSYKTDTSADVLNLKLNANYTETNDATSTITAITHTVSASLIETLNVNSIPRPILVGPDGTVIEPDGNKLRGKLLGLSVEAALKAVGLLKAPEAPAPEAPKADPATEAPKTETTTEANQG